MQTKDLILLAVTLLILGEVSYLLARLPKNSIKSKDRAILVDTSVLMDGRICTGSANWLYWRYAGDSTLGYWRVAVSS